jgi:hypothetical protein
LSAAPSGPKPNAKLENETSRFRVSVARSQAERAGDAKTLAELDQLAAGLLDQSKRLRRRLHRLRGRLRAGGGPGRPRTP